MMSRKQVKARRRAPIKLANTEVYRTSLLEMASESEVAIVGPADQCTQGGNKSPLSVSATPTPHSIYSESFPGKANFPVDVAGTSGGMCDRNGGNGTATASKTCCPIFSSTSVMKKDALESEEKKVQGVAETKSGLCVVCNVSCACSCSACAKVFYCGKSHQKKHWNEGHKLECYPGEDMKPEEHRGQTGPLGEGPYLRASKDLKAMDKIFEDSPIMTGPGCCANVEFESICMGCTRVRLLPSQKCFKCQWPLCGRECEKSTLHQTYECEIFAENGVQQLSHSFQYDLVRILRCLLTKEKAPDVFKKLMALDSALEMRSQVECLIEATKTACMFIKQNCKLTQFDDATIDHMCGVVDLQSHPTTGMNTSAMQIYMFPAKLLHACNANTRFLEVLKPNGQHGLLVVASRDIEKNEPLTQRLLYNLEPTYERQKYLRENYYFKCKCTLCADPTENETYFSAIACEDCFEGKSKTENGGCKGLQQQQRYMVPECPPDLDSDWICLHCKAKMKGSVVLKLMFDLEADSRNFITQTLNSMDDHQKQILALRDKVIEYEDRIHPNNFHVWRLKQMLFNALTEHVLVMVPTATWNEFREMYVEIDNLAKRVLATVEIHQPGYTLIRGRTLHDMVAAFWAYIQWAVLFGKASSFSKHPLAPVFYKYAEEAIEIFKPEITDIGRVTVSLEFMRDNVDEIRKRIERLGSVLKRIDFKSL